MNEIPIPKVESPSEMLVRIASASLCHSDLQMLSGGVATGLGTSASPITLGHEGIGFIEEIGDGVKGDFKKGDRIGFLYMRGACCKLLALGRRPFGEMSMRADSLNQLSARAV